MQPTYLTWSSLLHVKNRQQQMHGIEQGIPSGAVGVFYLGDQVELIIDNKDWLSKAEARIDVEWLFKRAKRGNRWLNKESS